MSNAQSYLSLPGAHEPSVHHDAPAADVPVRASFSAHIASDGERGAGQ
jgi:hypothetical protein